jgi:flagellar motility protein MotE (MotC chaperone)
MKQTPETPGPATPSPEQLIELERLREAAQFWRSTTLSLAFLFALLLAVSFVQFAGTYSTCKIWYEARQEAYDVQQQSQAVLAQTTAEVERLRQLGGQVNWSRLQLHEAEVDLDRQAQRLETLRKQVQVVQNELDAEAKKWEALLPSKRLEGVIYINGKPHRVAPARE